jgi:hypothetical protein
VRPNLESLEDRLTPSVIPINVNDSSGLLDNPTNVTVATLGPNVTLRDAINAANNTAGSDSYLITLQANTTYDLTVVDNFSYGPDALPAIASDITIQGNGAVIQRDSTAGTPNFRLFYVSGGFDGLAAGNLTLEDLTLQGGVAQGGNSLGGGGGLGAGGAIFNQGTLALTGVTLTNNQAVGGSGGGFAAGTGGGGMGEDAPSGDGGGFGGLLNGTFGGGGGTATSSGGGGGGGGFGSGDTGGNATMFVGGNGGGLGGFGGSGSTGSTSNAGDGGGGGSVNTSTSSGGDGGGFGSGGLFGSGAGGGGGIGGGGGAGLFGGGGGGFGGGGGLGGTDTGTFGGGDGGFGGGGGAGFGGPAGLGGFGGGTGGTNSTTTAAGGGGAGMGGGIFIMFGTLTITNSTLKGNTAQGGDGFNGGSGLGGAIFNLDGTLNLTFCTLADNTVTAGLNLGGSDGSADGGAVFNLALGNDIAAGGAQSATATIADSILSNSTAGNDLVNNEVDGANTNTATVTLSGPNLVQTSSGTIGGTAPLTTDPQLGGLQNNGGLTPTMAVPITSPAYQAGSPVSGITTDQRDLDRSATTPTLGAFEVQAATIAASDATTSFSASAQNVTLTANVTSDAGTVKSGTVTFTVLQGSTVIGAATTSGTVSGGAASVSYTLPAGTVAGDYTIDAVYNPGIGLTGSEDTTHTLTVSPASTTTAAGNATVPFSTGAQNVTLAANVTSDAGPVNEGTVTFTIKQGSTTIGTAVLSNTLSNGLASVSYALPPGTLVGNYTIDAVYNPGPDFTTSSDSTHTLTVGVASTTIAASNATTAFSTSAQSVILTAQVSSTAGSVNEGTVTFTVKQGNTIVGTAVMSNTVSNGAASVSYALPAGTTAGNYTIDAVYNPGPNFAASSDSTHTLLVNPSAVQLTTINMAANLLNLTQTETLTAHVFGFAAGSGSGKMSFTLNGRTLFATVDGNGDATASVVLPLITAQSPQAISVTYISLGGPALSTTQTAFWQPLNALAISTATFAADGGQAIHTAIPGMPPIVFLFDAQGLLTGIEIAGFGVDISYNSFNEVTQISVNGVVITQAFYTPQGQLLGVATMT